MKRVEYRIGLLASVCVVLSCASSILQANVPGTDANSLLWRVRANNGNVSHVFGTCHSNSNHVFQQRKPVASAIDSSDVIIVESTDAFDQSKIDSISKSLEFRYDLMNGVTALMTHSLTEEEKREIVDTVKSLSATIIRTLCEKSDITVTEAEARLGILSRARQLISKISELRTDQILSEVGYFQTCKSTVDRVIGKKSLSAKARNGEKEYLLDEFIAKLAGMRDKRLVGLETFNEVKHLFFGLFRTNISPMMQVRLGSSFGSIENNTHEFYTSYLPQEDIEALFKTMYRLDPSNKALSKFLDSLLEGRNQRWVSRMDSLLRSTSCFVAVGAGHLGGKTGLLAMLRKSGYRVEPVLGGERIDLETAFAAPSSQNQFQSTNISTLQRLLANITERVIEETLKKDLEALETRGLVTVMMTMRVEEGAGNARAFTVDVPFTDRPEIKKEIVRSIRKALTELDSLDKYEPGRTFEFTIQVEL